MVNVRVPARSEVDHIGTPSAALAAQDSQICCTVAACEKDNGDQIAQAVKKAAVRCRGRIELLLRECYFEPMLAYAGPTLRTAMNVSPKMLKAGGGLLLSTDGDCRQPLDWISANIVAAAPDGSRAGWIQVDDRDATRAPRIFALRKRVNAYWRQVRETEDNIDSLPWDPARRHGDHTGANLALSVALYQRAGGPPLLPVAEDRGLVEGAIKASGKLAQPQALGPCTSTRTVGRAALNMAGDLQQRVNARAIGKVPTVPQFNHWNARARWRWDFRTARGSGSVRDAKRFLPPTCDLPLPITTFP